VPSYTFLTYNPEKDYPWSVHRTGCSDIKNELKGVHTNSGFPAGLSEVIESDNLDNALARFVNEELQEMGWTTEDVHVFPCAIAKHNTPNVGFPTLEQLMVSGKQPDVSKPEVSAGKKAVWHAPYTYTNKKGNPVHVKGHWEVTK
jgi:hypothetical protein